MTADQVPVGFGFVGSVDCDDWWFGDKRQFDGSKITVVAMFPSPTGEDEERLVMNLYAGLRWEHGCQISSDNYRWVAGVRTKRSKYCRVFDWAERCSIGAAEKVCVELTARPGGQA